jgi:hypothetical protein
MISKTITDLRTEIMTSLLEKIPNLDLSEGTPERDIFVEAPIAGQLITIWEKIIYTSKLFAPIVYYADLTEADITAYMANYDVAKLAATYSEGTVIFYTNTSPVVDIVIPDGTVVSTASSNPVEFAVQGDYTMYASIAATYYNAVTDRYEISCAVQAVNAGPDYRAGANTVTILTTTVTGINGVINTNSITGAEAAESINNSLRRVIAKFQGRGLPTIPGLLSFVQGFTTTANLVTSEDPEMLRDSGRGGAIDIYIIGETLTNYTDAITITSSGLASPETVDYTNTCIVMFKQPVHTILSVTKNTVLLSPNYYTLTKDTGILARSTRSLDKVEMTSAGLIAVGYFATGDTIEIGYLYNAMLETINTSLTATENYYINRDYLVREMTDITINFYMKFKELAGQDFTTVATEVELDIATFIDAIQNGGSVELADIIGVAKANASVDNIDLTTVALTATGGSVITTYNGDLILGKNQFPVSGTITLVRWTN